MRKLIGLSALVGMQALGAPALGQQSLADRIMQADSEMHLETIADNRAQHLRCVERHTRERLKRSKASDEAIVSFAMKACNNFENLLRALLINGPATIGGGVHAVSESKAVEIIGIRRNSVRQASLAIIGGVR